MNNYTVFDIETSGSMPWTGELLAVGIGGKVWRPDEGRRMARLLLAGEVTVVAHTNFDLRWLCLDGAKLGPKVTYHDTKVMAWLLDGTQELSLDALCARYLGYVPRKPIHIVRGRVMFRAKAGDTPIEEVPWDELEEYNASDIAAEAELYEHLRGEMQRKGLWQHFIEEEAPFSKLLIEMEVEGLPFDKAEAEKLYVTKSEEAHVLERDLIEGSGALDFNPGSPQQVAQLLYTDMWYAPVKFAIPRLAGMTADEKAAAVETIKPKGVKVTKIGREYAYGTQALDGFGLKALKRKDPKTRTKRVTVSGKLLNVFYGENPWVAAYCEWKKLTKLNGYLKAWIAGDHDGRLHCRFDQSGTITGRLTGRDPNLQQVSSESGIRGLFVGDLMVGDYGGLEARIAASMSGDPVMLDVFRSGKDLYGVLAAEAWGGPADKSNENRPLMKVIWLSSQYGAQGETLAQTMAIAGMRGYTPAKADRLLQDMMNTVPRLFQWREEVIAEARALGFVTTLGGRQRHLADIDSADWFAMARAERQAVSSLVQGSAADIVRRAMLACRTAVHPQVARICLQVHDEILWTRQAQWNTEAFELLVDICENRTGFELAVPLVFEATIADSWAAKGSQTALPSGTYDQLNSALVGAGGTE